MAIKIVILKSNETLICSLKELDNEYIMNYPRKVPSINYIEKTKTLSVSYESWCNMSGDESVTIKKDWVVSVLNPFPEIIMNYTEAILSPAIDNSNDKEETEGVTDNS